MLQETVSGAERPFVVAPVANRKKTNLGKEAVKAALKGEWERAVELNREILQMSPNDCEASNRLAKALMELAQYPEARHILETLCARAPSNNIARKNLARLEQLSNSGLDARPSSARDDGLPRMFIAESGKSCVTVLRSPADATPATAVSAGDEVILKCSGDGVAVLSQSGDFLGLVNRRLGRRVHKLIDGGNQYAAAVVGSGPEGLSIILRETRQHPALRNVVSFPSVQGKPQTRPAWLAEPPVLESPDEDAEPAAAESTADDPTDEDEGVVIAIPDEVADDQPDDDVPVLDADVDADSWPAIAPPIAEESDWE